MENMNQKDGNIRQVVPYVRQITEDGKAKLEVYRPTTNPIYIYTQVSIFYCVVTKSVF
jgi:facilitated trehalose transporter